MLPKPTPVVPGRGDDERAQLGRALDGARLGAVGESGERLDEGRKRDRRPVRHRSVAVGVDRALEPGDQLVAAPGQREASVLALLPADDPDRHDLRARRHSSDEPGHPGSVRLDPALPRRVSLGEGLPVPPEDVDASAQAARERGLLGIDPCVEKGDLGALPVESRQTHSGLGADGRRAQGFRLRRIDGSHRIDADHGRVTV
jgi:hypothetical protein